ncbi:MAG TPA: hypothetical protein VI757_09525 [Bacteroidia bacterium]|nr:hypothetical protein [Bacteroidia bacterium]
MSYRSATEECASASMLYRFATEEGDFASNLYDFASNLYDFVPNLYDFASNLYRTEAVLYRTEEKMQIYLKNDALLNPKLKRNHKKRAASLVEAALLKKFYYQ